MIENGFEFVEKNGGAAIIRALDPGAVCVVPDMLGGLPVTELEDRALARLDIKEVYLPKTLRRIGRYGFYNCEKLRTLHFYAETREIRMSRMERKKLPAWYSRSFMMNRSKTLRREILASVFTEPARNTAIASSTRKSSMINMIKYSSMKSSKKLWRMHRRQRSTV